MSCEDGDDECVEQYHERITLYMAISLGVLFLNVFICTVRFIRAYRRDLEKRKRKAKKLPLILKSL